MIIWWIEDDVSLRGTVEEVLARAGHTILTFGGVREVSRALTGEHRTPTGKPQILVTDLELRDGSGSEIIRVARHVVLVRSIVIVSGAIKAPDIAQELGVPLVEKPLNIAKIQLAVTLGIPRTGGGEP